MQIGRTASVWGALAATVLCSLPSFAATDPTGIWFDHNDRGAVEIKACASGNGLCGYVVHIKDPAKSKNCGLQILGEVTEGGGWIYSPERKRRYDVALTRLSEDKLRVVGNAGSRFFSRTFTWKRAPDNIERCGEGSGASATEAAKPQKSAEATSTASATRASPPSATTSTGAMALMASTSVPKMASETTTQEASTATTAPAPASATAAPTAAAETGQPAAKTTKTATLSERVESSTERGSGKKCKYRIPYIGRTISAPCRN